MSDGRLVVVLHSHLPYVLGHGVWPYGEAWLYEAAADTYLPLLGTCERLVEEGVRPAFTIEISPVLGEQLDDPRFSKGLPAHLEALVEAAALDAEAFTARGEHHMAELAESWRLHYTSLADLFDSYRGDLLGGLSRMAETGAIELAGSARTHGLLPLLAAPERVRRQVSDGAAWFRRRFGYPTAGMWMPECAYRPWGPWRAPIGGSGAEDSRPGNEQFMEEAGIAWTVVDTHLVTGGQPLGSYPVRGGGPGEDASPYRPYRIGQSSVAAFPRDPATTLQVWSGEWGYPGNPWYLEFHKKHSRSGLRYWRVSDREADLGDKAPYEPARVDQVIAEQAHHFAGLVGGLMADARREGISRPVVTAPYDTELFGHWWFEGVRWLGEARRELHRQGIAVSTASEALQEVGEVERRSLPEGSWGDGGDFRVWDNQETAWIWEEVHRAERLLEGCRTGLPADPTPDLEEAFDQLERAVLLLESSDWPFLVTTRGAVDYAADRVRRHAWEVGQLAEAVKALLDGQALSRDQRRLIDDLEARQPLWLPDRRFR
ncbi:MAG: DUF1957 domain-containing protein [Actinomycetota bacterium]|nr:DUF1957 domain-containing protein [Actinomycetota bacterium]